MAVTEDQFSNVGLLVKKMYGGNNIYYVKCTVIPEEVPIHCTKQVEKLSTYVTTDIDMEFECN